MVKKRIEEFLAEFDKDSWWDETDSPDKKVTTNTSEGNRPEAPAKDTTRKPDEVKEFPEKTM